MSTNISVVPSEAVSSVGNSWIVCRSKTYAGRIYYFNTSTGETVWNLSEPEMLKAKAMTKILKTHSGFQPDNCPEPVHSPDNDAFQGPSKRTETELKFHNMGPAKIYNKQVINNQFTKPYTSSLSNYNMSNAIQLNIPVTPTFNGLWNLAPQPIFVATTPVQQLQHFPNFNQVPVTTTTVTLSNRFNNVLNNGLPNEMKFGKCKKKKNPNFNNNRPRQKYFNKKFQNKGNNGDLRLVISSRKSSFKNIDFIQPSNHSGSATFDDLRNCSTSNKTTVKNSNHNMLNDDDMWLEENLQSQGKTDKLDATLLKSYFQIASECLWYIIADSDALLYNINFLNILMNSDKQCRLIVPQIVMTIIQQATNSRLRTPARRAAYFISQQVDANLASIVPHNEYNEGSTDEKHCIITCCSKLMKQDLDVIILTDSVELNVLKDTGELRILTINEIKKLLSKSNSNEIEMESPKVMDRRNIKITIPNTNKIQTNLISPIEEKTDSVEAKAGSEFIIPNNVANNSIASVSNTNYMTNLDQSPKIQKKTENKGKVRKWYSRKINSRDSLDSTTKSNGTCNSKNSNFESSSESVDEVGQHEDTSGNSMNVNIKEISETSNTNEETRRDPASKEETKEMEYDNVMFEVTSQAMEQYLKMKSDEWVSRFIQIMEEVLAEILQQEPKFVLEALPPPWTVYEATECIKRKFKSDSDIVDAATKLLNVLFGLGGLRGKIKNDPSPEKYMEMYSFGVYLIDALQGLLSNSEDLQTAAESLSKLLNEIQNPHLDPCNQDSFADHIDKGTLPQDDGNNQQIEINTQKNTSAPEELEPSINNSENLTIDNTPRIGDKNSTPNTPRQFNLRSNKKRMIQDKEDVIFIRNLDIESSFFACLELRKNTNNGIFSKILTNDTQLGNKETKENDDQTSTEINIGDNDVSQKEPTFIRNVTKCKEYEEKLKEKSESYDSWTYRNEDYEDCEEELNYESMEKGYYLDGEEIYESDEDPDEVLKYSDDLESYDSPSDDIVDFKFIVQKMEYNIKGAYSAVYEFCKNSHEKLSSTTDSDKSDILVAEKTYLFIDNLCNTFTRILERETSGSEYTLHEIFKSKEFEKVVVAEKDLENYRNFINSCLVQGNVLKESVRLIIEAIKEA